MSRSLKILFFTLVVRPMIHIVFGLNVRHRERIPGEGPAIVVANHNSHLDTVMLMTLFCNRLLPDVRPIAAADYFLKNRLLAWFSRTLIGIIPIDRSGGSKDGDPLEAIRLALDDGQIVIVFPEGSRGEPERLDRFKTGVARLSLSRPEVPVLPVFLHGAGKALPKGSKIPIPFFCDVFVGEALYGRDQPQGDDARILTEGLAAAMKALAAEGRFAVWE